MKRTLLLGLLAVPCVVWAAPQVDENKQVRTMVVTADVDNGGGVQVADGQRFAVVTQIDVAEADSANHGWLGIALGDASDSDGVVVLNVVEDSPAKAAGLQENDVILSINGEAVEDYKSAVDIIRSIGPDNNAAITVDRNGQTLTLNATLSARPQAFSWVREPDGTQFEDISKGNMFLLTPHGQQKLGGGLFNINKRVMVNNGEKVVEIVVDRDGEHMEIRQVGDGPITVDRNGVVNEYADVAALEAADADAAEVFSQSQDHQMIFMPKSGAIKLHIGDGDMDFSGLIPEDLHEHIQQALSNAKIDVDLSGLDIDDMDFGNLDLGDAQAFHFGFGGTAKRSFRQTPNGEIEVVVRKGADELVTVYSNAADLEARNPELYEKYADLLEATPADQE